VTVANVDQRERLLQGMIQATARYGYDGASVARVVEQAGVSRATFYEHFSDREACFLALNRDLFGGIRGYVERLEELPPRMRVFRDALEHLLEAADTRPAAARVVTLEALGGEAEVRREHEEVLEFVAASIGRKLAATPAELPVVELPTRALIGGVGTTVVSRLFSGETGRLVDLLDDLLVWIATYAMPPGSPRLEPTEWEALGELVLAQTRDPVADPAPPSPLPRGRGALPRGKVASEQRQRILAAVAQLSRERGYREMTVAEIVAAASVSREVFYEQFHSKEDAFLAALNMALQGGMSGTAGKFFGGPTWPDRVWGGLRAMLRYMASNPDFVWVSIVDAYSAGHAAVARAFDNRMTYTLFLEDGYRQRPEAEGLPRLCSEAIGGAIFELVRRQAIHGRTPQMLELLPQAAFVAMAPFTGAVEALELVRVKCRTRL
jgi:AcrR family transcriptional regulator